MYVRLLGEVGMGEDASSLVAPQGQVAAAVLAHLALGRGRIITPESLIDAVWDVGPETARNAVQVGVSKLRKQLGAGILEGTRAGYRLRTDMIRVDWFEAEQLLAQARLDLDSGRYGSALDATTAAEALFEGEPLVGLPSNASEISRHAARELRTSVAVSRARALLGLGRAEEVVEALKTESTRDPLSEPVHILLMEAYATSGRQAEALAMYDGLRTRLRDELGISPSAPAKEFFAKILKGFPSPSAAPAPAGPAPALSLPVPGTPLVGREHEVDTVVSLVSGGHRMVTLLGPGGIGKTRLAIEAGRRIATDQERPVVFVDLTAAETPADVIPTVSKYLGTDAESLVADLQNTRTLLVLDNAEHVLAGVAEGASLLLTIRGIDLLVTSRSPVHLQEEHALVVDGLIVEGPLSPALQLLADCAGYGATEIGNYRKDLEALVKGVDGVPLVLELLSSALRWQTPARLLEDLTTTLAALTDDTSRNRTRRHSSIAAAVGWSLGNASRGTRRALSALSIIKGSFSEQAATAVTNATGPAEPARVILASLIDLSLVKRVHEPGEVRFRILEPIRLYTDEDYAEWARDPGVRMAYSRHYLSTLDTAHDRFGTSSNGFDDMVRTEEGNLKQSLTWAWDYEPDVAVHYMAPLLYGWYRASRHDYTTAWSTRVLTSHHGAAEERTRATLVRLLCLSEAATIDSDELRSLSDAVSPFAASLDDEWHRRWIHTQINRARRVGDLELALTWTEKFRRTTALAVDAYHSERASILGSLGRWNEAEAAQAAAMAEWTGDEHRDTLVYTLSSMGYIALVQGKFSESEDYLSQALKTAAQGVTPLSILVVELNVAWLELARGNAERALSQIAVTLSKVSGLRDDPGAVAEAMTIAGLAFLDVGKTAEAAVIASAVPIHADNALGLIDPYVRSGTERLVRGCEQAGIRVESKAASLMDLVQLIESAATSS